MERITARSNPLMLHIRKLGADKSYRRARGEFLCEGPKLLEEALHAGAAITLLLQSEGGSLPVALESALPAGLRRVSLPADLLAYIADTKTPQGPLFLCALPALSVPQELPRGGYLLLDALQDPGNLGSIWRSADAFGAQGIFLLPGCADPFSPKVIRASMGACFRLPLWEIGQDELLPLRARLALPLWGAALRADAEVLGTRCLKNSIVAIGSEGRGLSNETLAACEGTILLPMRERCESLNAAVAAAVILWEMARVGAGE